MSIVPDAMSVTRSQELLTNPNISTRPQENVKHSQAKKKKKSEKPVHRTIPRAPHRQLFLTDTSRLLPFHVSKRGRDFAKQLLHQEYDSNTQHLSYGQQDKSFVPSSENRIPPDSLPRQDTSAIQHSRLSRSHEVRNSVASDAFFPRDLQQGEQTHDQRVQDDIHQMQHRSKDSSHAKSLHSRHIHTERFFYISEPVELQIETISGPCVRFMLFLWYFTFLLCILIDFFPQLRWDMVNICDSKSVSLKGLGKWSSPCFQTQPSSSKPGHFNVTWIPNLQEDRITPYYALRHIVLSIPRSSTQPGEEVRYSEPVGVITGDVQDPVFIGPVEMTLRCSQKNSHCEVLKLPGGVTFPFRGLFFPELSPDLTDAITKGSGRGGPPVSVGIIFERKNYTLVSTIFRYTLIAFSLLHMLRFTVYRKFTSHLYEQSWVIGLQIFLIFYLNPLFAANLSSYPSSGVLKFFEASLPTCFVAMNLAFMYSVMTASMLWRQHNDKHKEAHVKDMIVDGDEESIDLDGAIRTRSWLTNLYKFVFCSKNLYDPPFWTKAVAILYVFSMLLYQIIRSISSQDYDFAAITFTTRLRDVNWGIFSLVLGCLICFGLLIYLNDYLGKKPYLESRPQQLACCMFLMIFLFIILFYIVYFVTFYVYISRYYPVTNPQFMFTHPTSLALNTLFVNIMTFVYTTQQRDENVPIHPKDERWMFMLWPHTWHIWLARHGGSQYIFFTERQETNFYTLQLDFRRRQLMVRLKRKRDSSKEGKQRAHEAVQANLDASLPSGEGLQTVQPNQTKGCISHTSRSGVIGPSHRPTDPCPYAEEAKQNENALSIPSASKMAIPGKSQSYDSHKEHLTDAETVTVPIRVRTSFSPSESNSPSLTKKATKNNQGNLPYGFSASPKPPYKYHSRMNSKVGFIEENLNQRSGTCKGDIENAISYMDRFSSSYLPELPENDALCVFSGSRRHMARDDKAPFLTTNTEPARVVEPHASTLLSPGLVCGLEGPAKHSARLEASVQRECTGTTTELTPSQPHCTQLALVSPQSRGVEEMSSQEGYSPPLSATNKDGSSIRSVAFAMRILLRSNSPSLPSDATSAPCGLPLIQRQGTQKQERSQDNNIAQLPIFMLRQPSRSYPAHTPKEEHLNQPSENSDSSVSSELIQSTFHRAVSKVHIGINKLVGVAERNLLVRPMHHIDHLQKIVQDVFYKPFGSPNYLPFFNLETAIDCFNLSWEVYNVEENSIVEYAETGIFSTLNKMLYRVVKIFDTCSCRGSTTKDVSKEDNKLSGSLDATKVQYCDAGAMNRTYNDRAASVVLGEKPIETGEACHVGAETPTVSNQMHFKTENAGQLTPNPRAEPPSDAKIDNERSAHLEYPHEGNSSSMNHKIDNGNKQTRNKATEEQTNAPSDSSHCAHHVQVTTHKQSVSPLVSDKPQLPTRVIPMNVEKYGYKPILVTQIKEVQVLMAQIDTDVPEHLYKAPRIVIALRGTANWSNARDDMNVDRVVWDEMVEESTAAKDSRNDDSMMTNLKNRVCMTCASFGWLLKPSCHGGFLTIWKAMRPVVIGKLLEVLQSDPNTVYRVFTTGHSLGGALASFCAYSVTRELHRIEYPIPEVTVYSYGTPRIGNAIFCRLYNDMVPRTFHVTNESDIVSRMGILCESHVGIEVKIDRNGNYIVKPTDIEKIFPPTKGSGLSVMNHLMTAYGDSLNTIAKRSQCLARCWEPYITITSETPREEYKR